MRLILLHMWCFTWQISDPQGQAAVVARIMALHSVPQRLLAGHLMSYQAVTLGML